MDLSLKPRHLARYKDIAVLILRHARAVGQGTDKDNPTAAEDARDLADRLEQMGPTFVKLGQLLSTRSDLLPPPYLEALARLQDQVCPVPFADVADTVTTELGINLSRAFATFDPEPLASASLGQVHKASLGDGRQVAVKVQRPGVKRQVIDDLEVIEELATFIDDHTTAGRNFGFAAMVEEFRRSILSELDYRTEAANLEVFATNLADYDRLVVPKPVADHTTDRILTMDLISGRNVGSVSAEDAAVVDGRELATQLFGAYLDQILVHGLVHADPHPGNVLLTADGCLGLVDVGMVVRVGPDLQDELLKLLLALNDGRGQDVAAVLTRLGERRDDWDEAAFDREIDKLVQQHRASTVAELHAGQIVASLARIAGECGLRPPAEMTMLGKALLNLDQVAARLDPEFDPNAAIEAHVTSIMRHKVLQSAAPTNVLAAAMEAKEFAEKLPGRVNKVMDALAKGELTLNVEGVDEEELMRGIQKLANRVTTGVIIAALILGAAMLMRVDTTPKLLGYPALAIICFLLAAAAGVWLIANSILHDLPQRRRRSRHR